MLSLLRAIGYLLLHPYDTVTLTVVRRYVDAQGHFIGELYEGTGRSARMVGMTCDNLPLEVVSKTPIRLCWKQDFLAPLPANTVRVGGQEPQENAGVRAFIALRRFCPQRIAVLNRFVEHVLESDHVR